VAEKLDAIISLGMANSRMKDYFDLWVILNQAVDRKGCFGDAAKGWG